MNSPRQMHLGLALDIFGCHRASWRHPEVARGDMTAFDLHLAMARKAEQAAFDFLFMADSLAVVWGDETPETLGRQPPYRALDPSVVTSALAGLTKDIGLVVSINTTYSAAPYTVARLLASLDHVSGGRAGWNLVTGANPEEAQNFTERPHPPAAERYERATEFAQVLFGLWESWDEDAIVCDKQTGFYFDPAKMHILDHHGKYFRSRGPLTTPRPPQGRPVTFQAGNSNDGRELAAATADVVFALATSMPAAKSFYDDVKGRMARYGRSPDEMRIIPGVQIFVGRSEAEARGKVAVMEESYDIVTALHQLNLLFGIDLRQFPLDKPMPDVPLSTDRGSRPHSLMTLAKESNLTLRQLAMKHGSVGHWTLAGTPKTIADTLQAYLECGAADGFMIQPPYIMGALDDFIDLVLPELRRRGLFRTRYDGHRLRDHLKLGIPTGRGERASKVGAGS